MTNFGCLLFERFQIMATHGITIKAMALSWRMLRRDARAGELRLLVAALVVAVAALTAVGFFADRVRQALESEAHQLIGADLLLSADHPWSPSTLALARGLRVVETRTFPSMVRLSEGEGAAAQLSEIKAVGEGYPLLGALRVAPTLNVEDAPTRAIPAPGCVWIDERLMSALAVRVGETVRVGQRSLRVDAVLTLEPDRGVNFFSVAPRLLMNLSDVASTALVQVGSRVTYRLLLAGDSTALLAFRRALEPQMARGERIEDAQNARPEIRAALDRAQKFLGLSALLTVILAAVAVALAARRYMQRHLDSCAVMRCLGATQAFLLRIYLGQFLVIGLAAGLLGCIVGYVAHFALHVWLAPLLALPLPTPSLLPAVQGLAVGLLLLFGFAIPPLIQLKSVPPLRVLRRELGVAGSGLLGGYLLGFLALGGLMFWIAGEVRLGAYVAGSFTVALLIFATLARLTIRLAAYFRSGVRGKKVGRGGIGWRYGLARLERHSVFSVLQIVALALGFMALLLLTVTRGDLVDAWRRTTPLDAPNRFVINIQPEQLADVRRLISTEGLKAELLPMVRGRLTRLNGIEVNAARYEDEQAKRLVEREFNLSWRADLPVGNTVSAGRWFTAEEQGHRLASIENGLAKTLGLKVGDQIEFTVAGEKIEMTVSGLRKLDWDTMRVNFFVLTPPRVLEPYPTSWITSFYLAPSQADFTNRLVRKFPNLTVVDVAAILRQVQAIIDQVVQAVQFVFLFTLAAGVIVLYAALASSADERRYELAIMRALGARRDQLRGALLAEFAVIGGLAGLIAALGAVGVGQLLARHVFHFEVALNYGLPLAALLGGALLVSATGWLAASRLLRVAPIEALRAGA